VILQDKGIFRNVWILPKRALVWTEIFWHVNVDDTEFAHV